MSIDCKMRRLTKYRMAAQATESTNDYRRFKMVEPVTVGVGALMAYVSKDGMQKLLGPTLEMWGGDLRDFVKSRTATAGEILRNAESKVGPDLERPGAIPPKVLKAVLNDGTFSDDRLAVEYLGGVLASSRTEFGRDDRGARAAKIVDALSTYQLRMHYLLYSTAHQLLRGKKLSLNRDTQHFTQVFLPYASLIASMDFSSEEFARRDDLLTHCLWGLYRDGLVGNWTFAGVEAMKNEYQSADTAGVIFLPTAEGVDLFMWALGKATDQRQSFFDKSYELQIDGVTSFVTGSALTHIYPTQSTS